MIRRRWSAVQHCYTRRTPGGLFKPPLQLADCKAGVARRVRCISAVQLAWGTAHNAGGAVAGELLSPALLRSLLCCLPYTICHNLARGQDILTRPPNGSGWASAQRNITLKTIEAACWYSSGSGTLTLSSCTRSGWALFTCL